MGRRRIDDHIVMMIGKPERNLRDHGRLLIRRAVLRDDWIAEEIFDIAAADQKLWTPEEWFTLSKELESSDLTVDEFLDLYGKCD